MGEDNTTIDDKTGLVTTGFLLISIALMGDEVDMKLAARGISSLDEGLVNKYWESSQNTQKIFYDAIRENKA